MAPFWAIIDDSAFRNDYSHVYYQVYQRTHRAQSTNESAEDKILTLASDHVQLYDKSGGFSRFQANWVLVVTWENLCPYPSENFCTRVRDFHDCYQEKMRGQRGRLPVQPLGYVMSTKVIFRRVEVFRDVRMQVNLGLMFERKAKISCNGGRSGLDVCACGRLRRQTSARTKTFARLKITFVDMTYPGQRPEPPSLSPHFLLLLPCGLKELYKYIQ